MKKVLAMGVALLTAAAMFAGCGGAASSAPAASAGSEPASAPAAGSAAAGGEMKKIGVLQLVAHDALDATYEGFVDGLAEAGFVDGENITIDYQNAQGDQSNTNTIASKLVNDGNDLILAIATPAAQAVANATTDIPILITAVTDPHDSGLVASNEAPGGNVTGTSDLTPVRQQMELLKELVPNAKTVGLLYSSSEANSVFQIEIAKAAAAELGLETEDYSISSTNEMKQVMESMVGKVDAVYTPTDNMIASAMPTVSAVALEHNLPVIVGEAGMVQNGGLASYSISYYELGKMTAAQAVKILNGEAVPADMPIEYQENVELEVNEETAAALGITIPESLGAAA